MLFYVNVLVCHDVVVITTTQLYSKKFKIQFCTCSNPACSMLDDCDSENCPGWK